MIPAIEKPTHDFHKQRSLTIDTIILTLYLDTPRRAQSEDSVAAKFMYYQEDKNRIKVLAPTFMTQHETDSGWLIKLDGIYNSITGAPPTGAPPPPPNPPAARPPGN